MVRYLHGFPIPQTYQDPSRLLVQCEQERGQHIYRRQRFNLEHQGWKNDNYGQPSWHRTELQNDFNQFAHNTFWNTWLGLGFDRGGHSDGVTGEELRNTSHENHSTNKAKTKIKTGQSQRPGTTAVWQWLGQDASGEKWLQTVDHKVAIDEGRVRLRSWLSIINSCFVTVSVEV